MAVLKRDEFTNKENLIMTSIFMVLTCLIAIVYPTIDKVLAIMGGLCAATCDYGIPMFCYVKLSKDHWTSPKNLACIIFFGTLNMCGYISVGVTIFEMITGYNTIKDYLNAPKKTD